MIIASELYNVHVALQSQQFHREDDISRDPPCQIFGTIEICKSVLLNINAHAVLRQILEELFINCLKICYKQVQPV